MSAPRNRILADIRRVASELHRIPTRDEYFGRDGKRLAKVTEHALVTAFPKGWASAIAATGIAEKFTTVIDPNGLELAKLREENGQMKGLLRDLESSVMDTSKLRSMIGSMNNIRLGENAGWLKGPKQPRSSLTGIPTLFISDIHFDEVVKPEQVNFVNEYNHEIAVKRIKHTFTKAIELTKVHLASPRYDGFVCAFGGDLLSGNIHEELAETNDQRILDSVVDLTDLLIEGIGTLADEFGKVFVPCVVGNHGRMHKKPRYKHRVHDNYEWLVYQYLSRHFKSDSRISFLVPDAADAQWSTYSSTYNLNHGDQFKGGSGISGIFTPLALGAARKLTRQQAVGDPFDTMMNGHWHQYIHTNGLIVNGSIKGYDEFAYMHNFKYERPAQALFITHPELGEIYRMPVYCDPDRKRRAGPTLAW